MFPALTLAEPLPLPTLLTRICYSRCSPDEWYSPKVHSGSYSHSRRCASMGLGKRFMTWIHHCGVIQSVLPALKVLRASPIYAPVGPEHPGNHCSFYTLCSLAFSIIPYSWNHMVCSLFRLASFTQEYAFQVPLCIFMAS